MVVVHLCLQVEREVSSSITVLVQNKIDLLDHAVMAP